VDAVCKAILKATKVKAKLKAYQVQAITRGLDAMGDVTIKLDIEGHEVVGRGVSPDIIEASARAYVNAINRAVQKGLLEKKKLARKAKKTASRGKSKAKKKTASKTTTKAKKTASKTATKAKKPSKGGSKARKKP
jgi:ABC-type proline/glycine betaine transport system ATPase subunit